MNKTLKKAFVLLFSLLVFTAQLVAQDAVTRALELINKSLILNDYDRAYSYAKFVVNYYDGESIPSDALDTVCEAVSERGNYLVENEKWDSVLVMEEELKNFPSSVKRALDPSLTKTKNHYKEVEAEKERQKQEAERLAEEERKKQEEIRLKEAEAKAKAEQEAETKRLIELYEQQRKQEEEKRKAEQEKLEQEKIAAAERMEKERQALAEKQAQELKLLEEQAEVLRKETEARQEMLKKQQQELEALQKQGTIAQSDIQRKQAIELENLYREQELQRLAKEKQDKLEEEKQNEAREVELDKLRQESDQKYRDDLAELMAEISQTNNDTINKVSSNSKAMMILLFIIVLIFIAVIIVIIILWIKQQKIHQSQIKETLMTMQAQYSKNANSMNDALPLLLQMQTLSIAANSLSRQNSALAIEDSKYPRLSAKDEKTEITDLINECKKYGKQVDEATGRKNVSSRVADLVLKISQQLGHTEYDCILYYAAALVYDIGFLSISSSVLKAGSLTEAQFKEVQTHAASGEKMIFFVDRKYRNIFIDATGKHHENLDGTGYPRGLKGTEIPYIARVIRVVESYIALISNRSYKTIMDRDAAIAELKNASGRYDQSIVDALDMIV